MSAAMPPVMPPGMSGEVLHGRRGRTTPARRRLLAETRIHPADLVLPLFVKEGLGEPVAIDAMPGVQQHSQQSAMAAMQAAVEVGVTAFLLFGIPHDKDAVGTSGWDPNGPVPTLTRSTRATLGDDVVVLADICLCEYTDHGHCGPLTSAGTVDNEAAVAGYVRATLACANAGADIVAPSGMMDGQVVAMRSALDAGGHRDVGIMAYAAKYHSNFYGPFRDAAESAMTSGDRAHHQMDPANGREAMREIAADLSQGADAIIIKPALPYLDVIAAARATVDVPILGYQVSGEYAMVHAAAANGWLDADAAMHESVVAIRRAGADAVITYAAVELAERAR